MGREVGVRFLGGSSERVPFRHTLSFCAHALPTGIGDQVRILHVTMTRAIVSRFGGLKNVRFEYPIGIIRAFFGHFSAKSTQLELAVFEFFWILA